MGDIKIRTQSYSSLSLFKNCPMQYKLRYLDGNYSNVSTLSLELGTLLHYVLEQQMKPQNSKGKAMSSDELLDLTLNGQESEHIIGLNALQDKYFEDYLVPGRKSGITYQEKINTFKKRLVLENNGIWDSEKEWNVLATELPFEFNYDSRIVIAGKIDRVDINRNGDLRVIDYKSSDSIYEEKDLQGALQMYVYSLAIEQLYHKTPIEYIYDFILLGEQARALTKTNYKKTMGNKLKKIIDELVDNYDSEEFKPKPSPLCHWCAYSGNSCVKDEENNNLCEYYSLWTPTNKTFSVNKTWDINETGNIKPKGKKQPQEFIW